MAGNEEVKSEEATWRQLNGNRRFTHSYVTEASSGFTLTILIIRFVRRKGDWNGIRKIRSIVGYISPRLEANPFDFCEVKNNLD